MSDTFVYRLVYSKLCIMACGRVRVSDSERRDNAELDNMSHPQRGQTCKHQDRVNLSHEVVPEPVTSQLI